MATRELSFEEMAVARGWITKEQIEEARVIQKKIHDAGIDESIEEILVKKGWITAPQQQAIRFLLGKGRSDILPGYEILSKIGQGGMGAVYKARQTTMDRLVAIKILLPNFAREKDAVERFTREAKLLAKLHHPNIVAALDAGYSNGVYYVVMEYVEGTSLEQLIRVRGRIPWKEAAGILRQAARALLHAEKCGVVHRDIKPANFLITPRGGVKIADFGLAKISGGDSADPSLTRSGVVMGSPAYMSPEQATGEKVIDVRSDLYSLGLTFYEMLSGKPAYWGDNAMAVLAKRLQHDVPWDQLREVPSPILLIGKHLTVRNRNERYASPEQLLADLDRVEGGSAPEHAKLTRRGTARAPLPRKRSPILAPLATAIALAAAGALAYWFAVPGSARPSSIGNGKKPAPDPPPPPVSPEELAEREMRELFQFEDKKLGAAEMVRRYDQARTKVVGTRQETTWAKKRDGWILEAIRLDRERILREVQGWVNDRKYAQAMREIGAARGKHPYEAWTDFLNQQSSFVEEQARKTLQLKRQDFLSALARDDVEGARQTHGEIRRWEIPSLAPEIASMEKEISDKEKELRERSEAGKRLEEDRKVLAEAWAKALESAARRDYAAALAQTAVARASIKSPEVLADLELREKEFRLVEALVRATGATADRNLHPARWVVEKAPAARESLSVSFGENQVGHAVWLFVLMERDALLVTEMLAQSSPPTIPPHFRDAVEFLCAEGQKKRQREKEAEELYRRALQKKEEGKLDEARKLVDTLLASFPETTLVATRKAEMESWFAVVEPEGHEIVIPANLETPHRGGWREAPKNKFPPPAVIASKSHRRKDRYPPGEIPEESRNYYEYGIEDARAGIDYKLWLEMYFENPTSNGVWVQIEDSEPTGNGAQGRGENTWIRIQYTPEGFVQGWGWSDRDMSGRWKRKIDFAADPGPTFRFRNPGKKWIRVYWMEEGAALRRLLLTTKKYMHRRPDL